MPSIDYPCKTDNEQKVASIDTCAERRRRTLSSWCQGAATSKHSNLDLLMNSEGGVGAVKAAGTV